MEHNAKKRFNIIDIIAVVLILAVLAFGAWKLLGSGDGGAAGETGMAKVTYVVRCEGVPAGGVDRGPGARDAVLHRRHGDAGL